MYSLVILLSMLGGSNEDQDWTNPVWERGYEIWSEHRGACLSVCDALAALQDSTANPLAECDLFAVEVTYEEPVREGTTVELPTFTFSTVTSSVSVPESEAAALEAHGPLKLVAPRILNQEEEEEKLGLTIPE